MGSKVEAAAKVDDAGAATHFSTALEPDGQRGRKRRRREEFAVITTSKTPSGESATFRGRRRHRSTSVIALSGFSSRNTSRVRDNPRSHSPSKKSFFWVVQVERRRSQSPSRSRSPNTKKAPRRRRQRTRSRGRKHKWNRTMTIWKSNKGSRCYSCAWETSRTFPTVHAGRQHFGHSGSELATPEWPQNGHRVPLFVEREGRPSSTAVW
ncbi:hypothetical protein B0H67DRAFT_228417 [Lasiosphaeris hirsuta]|uniref:Uncharacterized protein n=1 Tax=Lasiosphaeris hirsuta TaxID=260670 RepID=A0AA40AFK4_9PEZI|nr:hypothetical protein B0H67DRAFT_228417 [Lasiosphaeris hirsuta]